jgi:hypothetical protein
MLENEITQRRMVLPVALPLQVLRTPTLLRLEKIFTE